MSIVFWNKRTMAQMSRNNIWFGLFVHPFSHTCNIGHVNCRLQFMYYNITYNIWTSTQYDLINNNTKFNIGFLTISLFIHQ